MGPKPKYYILNQTVVDPDVAMKHREVISENVTSLGDRTLFTITFKQVLQDFGVRNWNGRNYSSNVVMNALDRNPLVQHDIKMGTWTGEYGHPLIEKGMNELQRQMTIFPPNACWTISKPHLEGNLLMAECTTLASGYGDMVRDRILTNYPAMASARAIGGVDAQGNVLPSYTPITYDCVIRPSHKVAYMVKDSKKINEFPIDTGTKNTMSECAVHVDITKDPSFKNFLLSESTSKQQINMLCGMFDLDYDSMVITESAVTFNRIEDGNMTKIVIPMRHMINAEYYNLFK